jgi:hypothetical protein
MNPERAGELDRLDNKRVDALRSAEAPYGYTFWGNVSAPNFITTAEGRLLGTASSDDSREVIRQLSVQSEVYVSPVAYDSSGNRMFDAQAVYTRSKISPTP